MDDTLTGSILSESTVEHKEKVAEQYGRVYKIQSTEYFLSNILADFNEVRSLTDRRLPSGQRHDLCGVIARMAGLVSMAMVNIGQYREAREWVHTARLAADESTEPSLRAWVATRAAVAHLHFGDPAAALVAAREAEMLTRSNPCDVTAMAWSIVGRAAGASGETQVARHALQRAEDVFTNSARIRENTAYKFTSGQLFFYASNTLTSLGETRAARESQDAALAAFSPDERLDPTLLKFDRASCLIKEGDFAGGARYATTVVEGLPARYRSAIVMRYGNAIVNAVPVSHLKLPAVRDLRDILSAASLESPPLGGGSQGVQGLQ
jgi:tetratricopeptide (TPR) repeat protein